jgi:hypothetical protein
MTPKVKINFEPSLNRLMEENSGMNQVDHASAIEIVYR